MRLGLIFMVIFILGGCASSGLGTHIPPQYPPLPGQEGGERLPASGQSRPGSTASSETETRPAVVNIEPEPVVRAVAIPQVVRPVRTIEMVADSINRAFASRVSSAEADLSQAQALLRAREAEVALVRARRPARPAGMLTSQAVDAAIAAESRWQQEVVVAESAWALAGQRVRESESARAMILQEKENAHEAGRNSFAGQIAPPATAGPEGLIVGRPSTAPVKRRP